MIRAALTLPVALALSLLSTGHSLARAAEDARAACGPEFRLDSAGGPLEAVAIHSQGPVPNCFAHTAATLYDAWGLSHAAPEGYYNRAHRSSPYWSSIQIPGHPTNILDSLGWLRDNGSCDQKAYSRLPSWEYEKTFNAHYAQLDGIWREAQGKSDEEVWNLAASFNRRVGAAILPLQALPELDDIFQALKAPSSTVTIATIYHSLCRSSDVYEKLRIPAPAEKRFTLEGDNPERFINQTLSAQGGDLQPLGLGFCAAAFKDQYISIPRGHITTWEGCGGHAVTLMGRRWSVERNQCEYLLRNSWGTSCGYYDPSAIVECEDKTKEVWVSGDWINRSVYATVYLTH